MQAAHVNRVCVNVIGSIGGVLQPRISATPGIVQLLPCQQDIFVTGGAGGELYAPKFVLIALRRIIFDVPAGVIAFKRSGVGHRTVLERWRSAQDVGHAAAH